MTFGADGAGATDSEVCVVAMDTSGTGAEETVMTVATGSVGTVGVTAMGSFGTLGTPAVGSVGTVESWLP